MRAAKSRGKPVAKPMPVAADKDREPSTAGWVYFLLEIHKAQCCFAGALVIAILASNIVDANVAMVFLFLPLSMNGIVPVAFAYVMLARERLHTSGITLLTVAVYGLSTVASGILYGRLRLLVPYDLDYSTFATYIYQLSAIESCGGLSALTACPDIQLHGKEELKDAVKRLRIMSPLVWCISTFALLGVLVLEAWSHMCKSRSSTSRWTGWPTKTYIKFRMPKLSSLGSILFWLTTLALVGCVVSHMSLLTIALSARTFDVGDWGFGQVVAVTVWIPPVLEYLYSLLSMIPDSRTADSDCSSILF